MHMCKLLCLVKKNIGAIWRRQGAKSRLRKKTNKTTVGSAFYFFYLYKLGKIWTT